jgi:hypothetical protein
MQRVELGIAGLTAPAADGLRGTESGLGKASLVDTYSANLALHPIATLVTTLALGGLLGAAAHAGIVGDEVARSVDSSVVRAAPVAPVASVSAIRPQTAAVSVEELPLLASASIATRELPPTSLSRPHAPVKAQPEKPAATETLPDTPKSELAEQLAELEAARNALGRKDPSAALSTLESHARRYPRSLLTEERDALVVKSLVLANRLTEARVQLTRFERQFPNSLLLPALKEAVGTMP